MKGFAHSLKNGVEIQQDKVGFTGDDPLPNEHWCIFVHITLYHILETLYPEEVRHASQNDDSLSIPCV